MLITLDTSDTAAREGRGFTATARAFTGIKIILGRL